MNTGQVMLTMVAIVLLALVILRVTNNFLTTGDVLMDTKFGVLAVSLATSLIEEANSKAFDTKTDTNHVDNVLSLTGATSLGKETGEVYPDFNDFDDFDKFTKVDSSMPSAVFNIKAEVHYISPTNPDLPLTTTSWHKRIKVTVTSKSMADTVRLSSIFSYWYFR